MRLNPRGGGPAPSPLAALAFRGHGVVSHTDLRGLGFSDRQIERRLVSGLLIRIHRGVYAVGHARLSTQGRWMAAVLVCGDGAVLSHADALALHDLRRAPTGRIHVTAAGRHRAVGVRSHIARDLPALPRTVVDGIAVTTVERVLLDEAVTLAPQRLRSLLEELERHDRFDQRRFDAVLAASNGHHGVGRLHRALASVGEEPPALRSGLEGRALELIRAAGLPEPSVNVGVAGVTVDLRWSAYGVTAEIDSWRYHRSRRAFEEDRRRGNAVVLGGEVLLRFTDRQIAGAPAAMRVEVAAALRTRGWTG